MSASLVIVAVAWLLLWLVNNHLQLKPKLKLSVNIAATVMLVIWLAVMVVERFEPPAEPRVLPVIPSR